jgi:hypothetical protein
VKFYRLCSLFTKTWKRPSGGWKRPHVQTCAVIKNKTNATCAYCRHLDSHHFRRFHGYRRTRAEWPQIIILASPTVERNMGE